jgi:hypothetical protein
VVWSYCSTDADAPTYAYAPSHLCSSPAQESCSPSLESSQNHGPPKHRPVHHSRHSEIVLLPLITVHFVWSIARQLSELGDILVHRHGPLFQILELLLLHLDNPLGDMMCMESRSKFQPVDALGFLMGFHISIPPVGCWTRKLMRG